MVLGISWVQARHTTGNRLSGGCRVCIDQDPASCPARTADVVPVTLPPIQPNTVLHFKVFLGRGDRQKGAKQPELGACCAQAAQHRAAEAEDAAEQAADAARAEQRAALAGSAGPPAEGSETGAHVVGVEP